MGERFGRLRHERVVVVTVADVGRGAACGGRTSVTRAARRVLVRGWVWFGRALAASGVAYACPVDSSRDERAPLPR